MPRCEGTLKNGQPCRYQAHPGHSTCGVHADQGHAVPIVRCSHESLYETPCGRPCEPGNVWCTLHIQREAEREERTRRRRVLREAQERLYNHETRARFRECIQVHADPARGRALLETLFQEWNIDLAEEDLNVFREVLEEDLNWWMRLYHRPRQAPPEQGRLGALAKDSQNVHTAEVNKQTDDGSKLLLETPVPVGQDTLAEIAAAWSPRKMKVVLDDMTGWYNETRVRSIDDNLYKRCLDGLWVRIKASPHKDELIKRLWEECKEAKGKCAGGHISRLCNVFVGFDISFQAPVPVGEILQGKMAAIAEKDVRVEHKVGEAWAVFEELGIPMDQRMDWLEAF